MVPGARERLVQITGPAMENILQARLLIEETIRRNASPGPQVVQPVRGPCSTVLCSWAGRGVGVPPVWSFAASCRSRTTGGTPWWRTGTRRWLSCRPGCIKTRVCLVQGVALDEYKYTVVVGDETVRVVGSSLDLVRTAKLVLDEYFSLGDTVNDMNKILLRDSKPGTVTEAESVPAPAPDPAPAPALATPRISYDR